MPVSFSSLPHRLAHAGRNVVHTYPSVRRMLTPLLRGLRAYRTVRDDSTVLSDFSEADSVFSRLRTLGRAVHVRHWARKKVLFYPNPPLQGTVLWKVLARLGIGVTTDPTTPALAAILWRDRTVVDVESYAAALAPFPRVLNARCTDISKSHVGTCFQDAFGYALAVEPRRYTGPMVVKSEKNATHDGHLRIGPLAHRDPAMAYQRLVDNMVTAQLCVDYRVPVIGGRIPLVYLRFRRHDGRFVSDFSAVMLAEVDEVFSAEEQEQILRFAERMGLDYGELDVLRDRTDERIYVVDCNKTPWGPSMLTHRAERSRVLDLMAPCVLAMIEETVPTFEAEPGGVVGERDRQGSPGLEGLHP